MSESFPQAFSFRAAGAILAPPASKKSSLPSPNLVPWIVREGEQDGCLLRIPPVRVKKNGHLHLHGCFAPTKEDRAVFQKTGVKDSSLSDVVGFLPIARKMIPQPTVMDFAQLTRYILDLPPALKPEALTDVAGVAGKAWGLVKILGAGSSQWCRIAFKLKENPNGKKTDSPPAGATPTCVWGAVRSHIVNPLSAALEPVLAALEPDFEATAAAMQKNAPALCGRFDEIVRRNGVTNLAVTGHSLGGWLAAKYAMDHERHPDINVICLVMASVPLMKEAMGTGVMTNRHLLSFCYLDDGDPLMSHVLNSSIGAVKRLIHEHGLTNFSVHALKGYGHDLPVDPVVNTVGNVFKSRTVEYALA